ncbi:MAG: site-2 protease family protein [Candidatus Latescibacterota bacterium]|jgi:Zn-dependent protease/predicted transcriptional regulator
MRQNIPLGRIMGIPLGLDFSWFLVFGLLTWMLAVSHYPAEFRDWPRLLYWFMGAVTAVLFFVSVVLHELGHSVVALRYKVPVHSITLFIFGGVARIGAEPPSAVAEFWIAIAGPIVSLVLAVLFSLAKPLVAGIEPLWGLTKYLSYINFALLFFNLIPGFPLDGGRVFRAVVWGVTKNMRRATLLATGSGRVFGFLFIVFGVWQMLAGNFGGGLWIAFIGWFLENAASGQAHQVAFQDLLAGHKVSEAMSDPCPSVSADLTLQQLVDRHILGIGQRCFLVNRGSDTVGLMTLHLTKQVARSDWESTTVEQAMLPLDQLKHIHPDTELSAALQEMNRDGFNQLPVMRRDNRIVGMLSRDDVITFLQRLRELGE